MRRSRAVVTGLALVTALGLVGCTDDGDGDIDVDTPEIEEPLDGEEED